MGRRFARAVMVVAGALVHIAAATRGQAQKSGSSAPMAWAFSYTVTTTSDGRAVPGAGMVFDVRIWRGTAQVSVRTGPMRALTGDRGVMLVRAADSTLSVVNPQRREVLQAASGDLAALMSPGQGGVRFEVSGVTSTTRVRGRGDALDRYATQRLELDQRYTLQVAAGTMRRTLRNEQLITLDVSWELDRLDPGFRAFAEQFARSLGEPAAVRAALRAKEGAMARGIPVRSTTVASTISNTDTLRTETRAVMSSLRREAVDTMSFRVPADYRVTDVNRLLRPRQTP